jgi:hypothetical protein
MATRKRVSKKAVKRPKRRRTTKETPLTKLDFWAIAANEVYKACRRAGWMKELLWPSLWIAALILIG